MGQWMNYRSRSCSLGNSSTSSRSSDPWGTVSRRETYFLFAVLSVFTRFFLPFFSVSMPYFIIAVLTACETVSESTRVHEYHTSYSLTEEY